MRYFHLILIFGSSQSFAHPQDLFQAIASNLGGDETVVEKNAL